MVEKLGMKMRENRLRWYGHEQEYVEKRVMEMELPGKRKSGRPKRRFLDVVKENMGEVGAREKDIENRILWRNIIHLATPDQRKRMKEGSMLFIKYVNTYIFLLLQGNMFNNTITIDIIDIKCF